MISNPDTSTPSLQTTVPRLISKLPHITQMESGRVRMHCQVAVTPRRAYFSHQLWKIKGPSESREGLKEEDCFLSFPCNRTAGTPGSSLGCITEIKSYLPHRHKEARQIKPTQTLSRTDLLSFACQAPEAEQGRADRGPNSEGLENVVCQALHGEACRGSAICI